MHTVIPFPSPSDDEPLVTRKADVRTLEALLEQGAIQAITPELRAAQALHPVTVTPALMDLINPNDPYDPIAQQFIPSPHELEAEPRALPDPIGDQINSPVPGIVHRYPDRLLLNLLHACPAYCRFCFRRGRVGPQGGLLSPAQLETALNYIRAHKEIWEVILSGGEPLMLSVRRLRDVFMQLHAIEHVKTLRIHTRSPITTPERFTPELVRLLAGPKPVTILVHCNHPNELSPAARTALARLADAGIPLYSQSVLLKNVNDDVETLTALMRAFIECRIKPHYLHHPDLVAGTHHFRVSLDDGIALVTQLQGRLSGLCQPRYILDIPGGAGKVNILSPQVQKTEKGWRIENYKGEKFFYEG